MKKRLYAAALVVIAALVILPIALIAQGAPHVVEKGDTLWKFRGTQWRELIELNPKLRTRIRETGDPNKVVVIIREGEELLLTPELEAAINPNPEPAPEPIAEPPAPKAGPITPVRDSANVGNNGWNIPWGWIIALIVLLLLAYLLYRNVPRWLDRIEEAFADRVARRLDAIQQDRLRRQAEEEARNERLLDESLKIRREELARDPIKSGRSFLDGGIPTDATPEQVRDFVREAATRQILRTSPAGTVLVPRDIELVGDPQLVTLNGEGNVFYRSAQKPERRNLANQAAFRARYRVAGSNAEPREITVLAGNLADVAPLADDFVGFEAIPAPTGQTTDATAAPAADATAQVAQMDAVAQTPAAPVEMDAVAAEPVAGPTALAAAPAAEEQAPASAPTLAAVPFRRDNALSVLITDPRVPGRSVQVTAPVNTRIDIMSMDEVRVHTTGSSDMIVKLPAVEGVA